MKTFRHCSNERNKANVIKLRMKYGAAGYGVYMMILERLAEEPQLRAELDYDVLAYDFHVETDMIRHIVEDFDLFIIDLDGENFHHEEIDRQLTPKTKREQQEKLLDEFINRKIANKRWIENTACANHSSPEQIRAILLTSFRAKILAEHLRIPDPDRLRGILSAHITDIIRE